jgi:VCBS repeat-containing protein
MRSIAMNLNRLCKWLGLIVALAVALGLLALVETNPAEAAFPGTNDQIAFTGGLDSDDPDNPEVDLEIYTMMPDGTDIKQLTSKNDTEDLAAKWSPDGQQIAFSSSREGSNSYDIYVMNANGSNQTSLTNAPSLDIDPAWSPDGQQIMFVSAGQIGESNVPNGELYVMNADGSNQTRITNTFRLEDNPDWQAHNVASRPPVASNDSYTTNQGQPLNEAAPGVLANDTDPEGDTLTAQLVSGPSHGTLMLNGNGSFTYTPNANYNGADSFTYKANDGTADSNPATVSITVNPVATSAPRVTGVSPPDKATGVSRSTTVTATFNVAMKPSSLTNPKTHKSTTFILMGPGRKGPTQVSATVTCNTPCTTATLTPSQKLAANTTYTARVTTGVEDTSGKKLGSDYTWSFATGG